MIENDITDRILDCCFNVHKNLGPGLFESVYIGNNQDTFCCWAIIPRAGISSNSAFSLAPSYGIGGNSMLVGGKKYHFKSIIFFTS